MSQQERNGEFVTSRKANVTLKTESGSSMFTLRQGAVLKFDTEAKGYKVVKPSGEEEAQLVVDERTFNSLKENKCIVSSALNKELNAVGTKTNVQLERKVIELTTRNNELEEEIETLAEELEQARQTIAALTNGASEDSEKEIDDEDADADTDEDADADLDPNPDNFVLEEVTAAK